MLMWTFAPQKKKKKGLIWIYIGAMSKQCKEWRKIKILKVILFLLKKLR